MRIVIAASEVVPYAKTGGLADVAAALPKALLRLGHDVRVVMPRYNLEKIEARATRLPGELNVPFAFGNRTAAVYKDNSSFVPIYFIDAPEYFSRGRLYGESDDAERFAFFSRAVLEFTRVLNEPVDIIHCNDWMTGLVPAYLKTAYAGDERLSGLRSIFTIHNMAFQGMFDAGLLPKFGLPDWLNQTEGGIEFYGSESSLKAGLLFSDAITTVSPRYSHEIQTAEFGERFDGLLRARKSDLVGILNGIDYDEWSPEIDPFIKARFSANDLAGKRECKRDLLKSFGLKIDPDRPLIGCISRLSDQKGFDLILEVIEEILDRNIGFVLLGSGAEIYERALQTLRDRRSAQVGVYLGFSNELAHKIEAGADMFLMPSKFEPCGLNQMYSLRYGTVPIVRAAGGLDDTVQHFDRARRSGNGFKFTNYSATQLLETVYEALLVFDDPGVWRNLMLNGMSGDYSWASSARRYVALYEALVGRGAAATV